METLFIGKNIIFLHDTHSTNSYAIDLLKNVNLREGTVIHTSCQTQGKGQRGSAWISDPASNLTLSIVLKPTFLSLENQFYLYMIAALACYDTTAELLNTGQFDIKIKWPNDILVNRKKIAGILIENKLLNNTISHCVVGIGMNIRQRDFRGLNATSLSLLSDQAFTVETVMERLCFYFEQYYLNLKNKSFEDIRAKYLSRMYGLNEQLMFRIGNKEVQMTVMGVAPGGLLLLQNTSGQTREMDVKELSWLL